jgi:putative ABC transport system substrate-binding protein
MRRREFLTSLAGASMVLAWPLRASAQQSKAYRVGALLLGNADAESFRAEVGYELRKSGYVEGQNVSFDFRSAQGKLDLLPKLAAELVALKPDVIVALYTPCAFALQAATREIPVVIVAANPVETGLIASLARPGGNLTGVSLMAAEAHGKCVELFHDMLPSVRRIAALANVADPFSKLFLDQVQMAARSLGIEIAPVAMPREPDQIDAAFSSIKMNGAEAIVVQGSLSTRNVAELALKHRMPAATFTRSFAEVGGLMSYGPDASDSFRRAAFFVIKVLQGAKAADMPAEQPTKFELVINLKTAKALGLTVPPTLLARADEVIE